MNINALTSKFKWHFSLLGVLLVIGLFTVSTLPDDIGMPRIEAAFSTPVYADTYISYVSLYDNETVPTMITYWAKTINPDATPNVPINTTIGKVYVEYVCLKSRLAPGGAYIDHVHISVSLIAPDNTAVSLSYLEGASPYKISETTTTFTGYVQWMDLTIPLDQVGTYRLYVSMSIEIP